MGKPAALIAWPPPVFSSFRQHAGDVHHQVSAQRHVEDLLPTADPQDRLVHCHCLPAKRQFKLVAFEIYSINAWMQFPAAEIGVDIPTARDKQPIKFAHNFRDGIKRQSSRQKIRSAAGCQDGAHQFFSRRISRGTSRLLNAKSDERNARYHGVSIIVKCKSPPVW